MRIGIDLGGTKIEGLVLDDTGKERARVRVATPQASYEATVDGVATVVRELEAKVGARCRVGVGHPGAISPATGLIKNANSTRLNGHPLDRDLKRILERDEVRFRTTPTALPSPRRPTARAAAGPSCSVSSWAPAWAAAS